MEKSTMFIKHSSGTIVSVINEKELTEEQKVAAKTLADQVKTSEETTDEISAKKKLEN
jgi:hypothetical protein